MVIYIVLPAFNEEGSLPNLLQRFMALPGSILSRLHIVIVNDGSTDATRQIALSYRVNLPLTVVNHSRNMGLGQAIQTGIRAVVDWHQQGESQRNDLSLAAASGRSNAMASPNGKESAKRYPQAAIDLSLPESVIETSEVVARARATSLLAEADRQDVMIIMDADDTHDPNLVINLTAAIENGADIAIASRFVSGGNDKTAPFFRRLLSRGAAFCFKTVLPIDRQVNDFTSGFRAYRLSLLERAVNHWGYRLIEEDGFACMVELLLKLRFCKPRIVEVPFRLQYDRKLSNSKIRIFRTIAQYLKLALRDRISPPPVRAI